MIKRRILLICCYALFSAPLHSAGFDDLFGGMGDDPFAGFDFGGSGGSGGFDDLFGGGDFGSLFGGDSGGDPFASLFGGMGDNDSSSFSSTFGKKSPSTDDTNAKEKEPEAPLPATAEEAFLKGLEKTPKKVAHIYRDAVRSYLDTFGQKLHTLSSYLSGFTFGVVATARLSPAAELVMQLQVAVDQIKSQTVYHAALLKKDFEKTRKSIADLTPEFETLFTQCASLEGIVTDSLAAPTEKDRKKQDDVAKKVETFVTKKLDPIKKELDKVLKDKTSTETISNKQKKYKDREAKQGGRNTGMLGGWSDGSSRYFDNDFFGGQGGGWDSYGSGGNFWNDDYNFGGGYGSNSWGGSNWSGGGWGGGSSSYSSSSSNRPSSASSSSSSSSGSTGISRPFFSNYDDDTSYSSTSTTSTDAKTTPAAPTSVADTDLPLKEQLTKLARSLPQALSEAEKKYERDGSPTKKMRSLRSLLQSKSFASTLEKLEHYLSLFEDPESTDLRKHNKRVQNAVAAFIKDLTPRIPFLIKAVKYASPPFSTLLEEASQLHENKGDKKKAEQAVKAARYTMVKNYDTLMSILALLRRHEFLKPLHEAAVTELVTEATTCMSALESLLAMKDIPLSFENTQHLATLSRQLLQEPIVIGYAALKNDSEEKKTETDKTLQPLMDRKTKLTDAMLATIAQNKSAIENMLDCYARALASVKESKHLEDLSDQEVLENKEWGPALSAALEHEGKALPPYRTSTITHLEVQLTVLQQTEQLWKPARTEEDQTDSSTDLDTLLATDDTTKPESASLGSELDDIDFSSFDFDSFNEADEKPSFFGKMKQKVMNKVVSAII